MLAQLPIVLLFSAPPVLIVGSAAGSILLLVLRRETREWVHLLAFALAGALAGLAFVLAFTGPNTSPDGLIVPAAAVSALIGRLSIRRSAYRASA
ncbi:hypothetical protein [Arthrobacter bambusae]|uniref:Membrane-bound metal-dependent hydrolase YbcI (DUF457 family) n=1 Tax=Arthrobacter bambusae TaxID=1338426 RepID=A0AAW8DCC7_9MICC|nr:hypothetical protein [Arthrobacter bambusae]MDP9903272.1 membrane-bound metal-dependent hydrolase YbcI (DUF457 family) [Arthrobacter bambusae]MDQ0128734.1 membrane-bound metal-dependent hydrolase YbcI (DUF457 family) [Arthrobacter bambusae]MDQ0180075.1 membrane-bound metal-dependent hydrolase YbcI (DUF457 family) [Arthrobacter bambusae]